MAQTGERIKSSWLRDENAPPVKHDNGVAARVAMVVVLTLTLVGAMRWALNITNANARHISDNIVQIQSHIADSTANSRVPQQKNPSDVNIKKVESKVPGPSIDPVDLQAH